MMMGTVEETMMGTAGKKMATAVTSIEGMGMGMAAGMTGADIDIMLTATGNEFMWSRRSTMHRPHSLAPTYFFHPSISILKGYCLAWAAPHASREMRGACTRLLSCSPDQFPEHPS